MAVNVNGGALEFNAVINAGQFNAAINAIEKQLTSLTKKAEDEARGIDNLVKKTSLAIASYASVATAKNFIGDIVRVRGEFQQLEVAFKTMLKNKGAADKLLAEATALAAKTPFTVQEVGTAAKQLLAYGFAADNITKNIEMLGNVASGVGAPLGDIVYLYGTLRTQGRAYTKDIMQFTSRGIPIIAELAKELGVAENEVQGLVEQGKVGFPQVERAFKSMTGEAGLFFNLMQEQSKTLTGLVSNLQDAWSRMLNDIGKSNEGAFTGAIQAAISVVNNYQKVLDILKILVLTYGTYKAAVIATTAVQAIAINVAKGYTIAETLRYRAMLLSERAMKILNATMLSNPAVAVATGIALVVSALAVLGKETNKAKTSQQLLADAQEKFSDKLAVTEGKIRPYVEALKNANITEQQRADIYKKLLAIDPEIVRGLDAKTISYQNLSDNVNKYLTSLRNQIALEANKEAITASIEEEIAIQKRIDLAKKKQKQAEDNAKNAKDKESKGLQQFTAIETGTDLKVLEAQLKAQKDATTELGKIQVTAEEEKKEAKLRTVAVIEEEIKALKEQQSAISTTAKEFNEFQNKINALEKEKIRITGDKKANAAAAKEDNQRLKDLEQLNKDINAIEADARQSGLLKEQSQIDQINERYDLLMQRAKDLKASEGQLIRIENARVKQVGNVKEKEAFELYKRSLLDQKALFDQFEQYKLTVGEDKSKELLGIQQGDFTDYITFLQTELVKLAKSNESSTLGGKLKIQFLTDAIVQAEKDKQKQIIDEQAKAYAEMLAVTFSFRDKEKEINDRYNKLENALANDNTIDNKQERFAILKDARAEELKQLQIDAFKQSAIFKKLNEDITLYSRERIKELIKDLQALLKNTAGLSPVVKKQIEDQIKGLKDFLKETSKSAKFAKDLSATSDAMNQVAGGIRNLSNSVRGMNEELANTLEGLADATEMAANGLSAAAKFAAGDYVGAAADTISFITNIVTGFAKAKSTRREAQAAVEDFYRRLVNSEAEINQLYRERQREQVKLNKLKIDGLMAEKKLLAEQKKANEEAFKSILAQIQQQQYVSGQGTQTSRNPLSALTGVFGFLSSQRTTTVDVLSSLAGKSFADLEKLFLSGQLTDKAKELFLQLQKLKEEGVDIDAALEQNKLQIQELFTGTTSGSITDAIVDGFKNGKRSATDFADTFENLMRDAVFNALKFQALEGPLKEFYAQFAELAESDGILTAAEIEELRRNFGAIIGNAQQQFDQLQQVTNLPLNGNSQTNSLTGAIKGITEQQAQLLAGQFGGLRLTAIDQLNVARAQLDATQAIQVNTGLTSQRVAILLERIDYYFNNVGIKIR